jgi:hypothetical protein
MLNVDLPHMVTSVKKKSGRFGERLFKPLSLGFFKPHLQRRNTNF